MDQIFRFLPVIMSLLSRGGDIARIVQLVTEALAGVQALLPPPTQPVPDVTTARGLQTALKALGYDPGPIDGDYGAKTREAVRKFQAAWNAANVSGEQLVVDGWAGTKTTAALTMALSGG